MSPPVVRPPNEESQGEDMRFLGQEREGRPGGRTCSRLGLGLGRLGLGRPEGVG